MKLAELKLLTEAAKYHLDAFYDRSIRSWTIICKDQQGNQVGDAVFVASRREKDLITLKDFELPEEDSNTSNKDNK